MGKQQQGITSEHKRLTNIKKHTTIKEGMHFVISFYEEQKSFS